MAGYFHVCIADPTNSLQLSPDQVGKAILHVQFRGTGKNNYTLDYEEVEETLLTKFLMEELTENNLHEKLIKLTFNIPPIQDANRFCESVLEAGIYWNQREYLFLGHSETQLKKRSCFFLNASYEEIRQLLAQFGDFLEERDIRKRARKIGMLFAPLNKLQKLDKSQYQLQPDIKRGVLISHTFTDGCGFMSPEFSKEVQKTLNLDYQPSAVHVRYRGIEGMLVLKEDLTEVKVQFHYSMQKFATPMENMPESLNFLGVLNYSRPDGNGYLDTQMIMVLADRGVPVENFEKLQRGYYAIVERMCKETAEYFLQLKGESRLLQDIKKKRMNKEIKERLRSFKDQELEEMKKAVGNTRILVPQSRVVFAVCDPYNKLKYGECYFNPTLSEYEAKCFPGADRKFVVTRSPCYHPGDVRVLRLTDDKQGYEKLRDCLVLPVKGTRPHAFECAGGTLSGNKFFVSWNKNLIPKTARKPCDYSRLTKFSEIREALASCHIPWTPRISTRNKTDLDRQEMRRYFATFRADQIAEKIDATYMKYAAVFGPSSKECQILSKMFYQAVNLMEDEVILKKKLLNLEEKVLSLEPSGDTSPSSERSPLLGENNEHENVEERCPDETFATRFRRAMHLSGRPCICGHEACEKIEMRAREFVERSQREFKKGVYVA